MSRDRVAINFGSARQVDAVLDYLRAAQRLIDLYRPYLDEVTSTREVSRAEAMAVQRAIDDYNNAGARVGMVGKAR